MGWYPQPRRASTIWINQVLQVSLMYIIPATNAAKKQEAVAFSNAVGACYLGIFYVSSLLIHPFQLEAGVAKAAALHVSNQLMVKWS